MAELESNDEVQEQRIATASELLVAARQKSGLSQKDVADQLYLTTVFIRYIDEGAFHRIPKPAFIKGYLRSYARVVEASGDEIVGRYENELQEAEENVQIRGVTEETVGSANFTGPVLQTGLISLVGITLVIGIVWWLSSSSSDRQGEVPVLVKSQPESSSSDDTDTSEAMDFEFVLREQKAAPSGSVDDVVIEEQIQQVHASAMETNMQTGDLVQVEASNEADSSIDLTVKEVSFEQNIDGGINYIELDAGGFDEIEVTFSDECWLEIEDADGEPIYGDLNKAGDVLRVYGIAPFRMLFGRADSVSVLFNGDEVDIARFTTSEKWAKVRLAR